MDRSEYYWQGLYGDGTGKLIHESVKHKHREMLVAMDKQSRDSEWTKTIPKK